MIVHLCTFLRIVKQQLAFLKAVEGKLKGALSNSKSHSGSRENFDAAFSFTLPATSCDSNILESALWTFGKAITDDRKGEVEDVDDARGAVLLKTRLMTPDVQREWASSVPEMKEVCTVSSMHVNVN